MAVVTHGGRSVLLSDAELRSINHFMEVVEGDRIEVQGYQERELPADFIRLLIEIFGTVKKGGQVSIAKVPQKVTTTTAASMLGVSRPTVMKYIREGRLVAHKVGSHHRIETDTVLHLLEELKDEGRKAIFDFLDEGESS